MSKKHKEEEEETEQIHIGSNLSAEATPTAPIRYVVEGEAGFTPQAPGKGACVFDLHTRQVAAILTNKEEAAAWADDANEKLNRTPKVAREP